MTSAALLLLLAAGGNPAQVQVSSLAGAPIAGATLTVSNLNGGGASAVSTSDAKGLLTVTPAQLNTVCPPPPPCPPGAPCAAPRTCAPMGKIEAKGFLPMRVNPFNLSSVRLVPENAKVTTEDAALKAVARDPHWKAWVGGHPYGAARAAIDTDGRWHVTVESVSWPNFLPEQTAVVDSISAKVTLTSCPVQGSHLSVTAGASLEDAATGYRYQCDAPEPRCAPLLKPGATLVVGSYGVQRDSCEGTLDLGTQDGPVPPVECRLEHCHRAK